MKKISVKIEHVDKIEGHAGFVGHIIDGNVKKAKFEVQMGIRLFERILVGRDFEDAAIITSRVCGVCPVVHYLTSLKALEDALGIKITQEVLLLRKLLMLGQIIQSHALHTYFMSLGDFFNLENNLDLAKKFPKWTEDALEIRDFANQLIFAIGGRTIHPVACSVGGFHKLPNFKKLKELYAQIERMIGLASNLGLFFAKLAYPKFSRPADYIALTSPKEYAIYEGKFTFADGFKVQAKDYEKVIYESQVDEVKRVSRLNSAKKRGNTLMTGALARLNINNKKLNPLAKKILKKSGFRFPSYNTFHNIFAQVIEILHCLEETKKLLSYSLDFIPTIEKFGEEKFLKRINRQYKIKAGRGYAQIEAPRGTLYHAYEIDAKGKITWANIITPTAVFMNNLEEDLKAYLPDIKNLSRKERERKIKMLIRAYDPCITCSVH